VVHKVLQPDRKGEDKLGYFEKDGD